VALYARQVTIMAHIMAVKDRTLRVLHYQ